MKKAYIFLADGFEESEALITVDLLRRGSVDCRMVSVSGRDEVTGRSGITVLCDLKFEDADFGNTDALIVPGGMPGTTHLKEHQGVGEQLKAAAESGKLVAAVCAGPTVLGALGILEGKKATCYPGCESGLLGATVLEAEAVVDGNIITSRGVGTTIPFALAILEKLTDKANADKVAAGIVYTEK